MFKYTTLLFACVTLLLVSACSSSSNDASDGDGANDGASADAINDTSDVAVVLNGEYSIEATASTRFDNTGGTCGDATGTMTITDNVMTGSVLTTNGNMLEVEGTVTENGEVVGGFAQGRIAVATFTGTISGTSGSGDWEDNFECVGTWTAEKI